MSWSFNHHISSVYEHTSSASLLICVGALTDPAVRLWVRGFSCTHTKQTRRFIKSCIRCISKQHSKQNAMFIVLRVFHLGEDSGSSAPKSELFLIYKVEVQ